MTKDDLKKDIAEAKRWPELVERTRRELEKYKGVPVSLVKLSELFDCSYEILQNIGDSVDDLELVGKDDKTRTVKIRAISQS